MEAKNFRSSFSVYPPHWVKVEDGTTQCAVNCGRYNSYSHNRIIKIYVINKVLLNTADNTDTSVTSIENGVTGRVLLNLKGDKMTKVEYNGLTYWLHAGKCKWICENGAKVYDLNLINLLFSKI